jgi:type VI secretion system protein
MAIVKKGMVVYMKLLLSVISSNANLDRSSRITLNQESASIGRHEDNTLVLFDPKKYISSHHALIEYKAPDYFVTDLSANGVFFNQSPKPLGRGNKIKLKDGDQFNIGDYSIYVKLLEESSYSAHSTYEPIPVPKVEIFDDPFAELGSDPIQKMIESNELIPSNWKGKNELPEDPFAIPGLDSEPSDLSAEDRQDNTAFDHLPVYKEAFQPPQKKIADPPIAAPPVTNPADIFPNDWFSDKDDNNQNIVIDKDFPPIIEPIQPPPATTSQPVSTPPVTDNANELIQSFLKGAKLDDSQFADVITPQTFYIIGAMLRASVQGTRDVLDGRARIKNEMHLDVTLIRPKENNPIKFSVSTDEALAKLLAPADKAYLAPEKAISEAFDDIRTHQYSVIAGMKSALFAILKRFDPKILEERLQKQSPIAANIPIHKQAKLWSQFEELYEMLEQETKDNFYHLFGQAFADTYNQVINNLKKDNSN